MNDTLKTIEKRHSIRSFTEQPVSEEDLNAILEAANQAPSAHNQQAWRFVVVKGEKKAELAALVSSRAGDFPRPLRPFCAWPPAASSRHRWSSRW